MIVLKCPLCIKLKQFVAVLSIIFQNGLVVNSSEIGVVYSPFVRHGDGHNTQTYTREIVKVMLEVILDAGYGYSSVTTYGLGTPNRCKCGILQSINGTLEYAYLICIKMRKRQ